MNKTIKGKKPIILTDDQFIIAKHILRNSYYWELISSNYHFYTSKDHYVFSGIGKKIVLPPKPNIIGKALSDKSKYHKIDQDEKAKDLFNFCGGHFINYETEEGWNGMKAQYDDFKIASGYHYIDEHYKDQKLKIWSYDINSAYPYAMLKPMPDTTKPYYDTKVGKGQAGFMKNGEVVTTIGSKADVVFDLIDSPFKDYVLKYYKLKKEDKEKKAYYKAYLNIATGIIALHNPFIRNMIIHYSNTYIQSLMDENTVYCNVDSIYSLLPRYDLPIGDEIGQLKLEHENEDFMYANVMWYKIGNEVHKPGMSGLEDLYDDAPKLKYIIEGTPNGPELRKVEE